MSDDIRAVVPVSGRDLATMPIGEAIEAYGPNFAAVLPPNVPVNHFKRMVITAINTNPELASADRRTLFNAAVKCASDGLLPDGREAALVVFNTKVKNRSGGDTWIAAVQYLPMVAGIRKRLRNSGEVDSAVAEIVCRNDKFRYRLGDDPFIEHEPPPLDQDRGEEIGAYAIIRLTNGEVLRDVMRKHEIERARQQSRAPNSLMWTKFYGEGAKKTVLRRCAKAAPQAAMLEKLLARDDELPDTPQATMIAPPPERPRRQDFVEHQSESEVEPERPFFFTDEDGEVHEFADPVEAMEDYQNRLMRAAKSRGEDGVQAMWENGARLLLALRDHDRPELADGLSQFCGNLLAPPQPRNNADRGQPATEGEPQSAVADEGPDPGWLRAVADLTPQPIDLAGDELNWSAYVDEFVRLCEQASPATRSALQTTRLPHFQLLRRQSGNEHRRALAALTATVRLTAVDDLARQEDRE